MVLRCGTWLCEGLRRGGEVEEPESESSKKNWARRREEEAGQGLTCTTPRPRRDRPY